MKVIKIFTLLSCALILTITWSVESEYKITDFQLQYWKIGNEVKLLDNSLFESLTELSSLTIEWGDFLERYNNILFHSYAGDEEKTKIYLLGMPLLFLKAVCDIKKNTEYVIDFVEYINGPPLSKEQKEKLKWNYQTLPVEVNKIKIKFYEACTVLQRSNEQCDTWLIPLVYLIMGNEDQLEFVLNEVCIWKMRDNLPKGERTEVGNEFQHKYFNLKNRLNALDPSDFGVAASLNSLNQEWEELFSQYQASLETPENNKRSRIYQLGMRLLFLKRTLVLAGDPAEEIARLRMILDILEPTNEACEEWAIPLICLLMDNEVQINAAMQAIGGWKADHGLQEEESSTKSAVSAGKE